MTKRPSKKGLPKAVQAELDQEEGKATEPTLEQFIQGLHGESTQNALDPRLPTMEWIKANYKTKSAAIRYLVSLGIPVKVIAKFLDIKYQHARNVATSELKRGPNEDWRPKQEQPK